MIGLKRVAQPCRERREAGGPLGSPRVARLLDPPLLPALTFKFAPALLQEIWGDQTNAEKIHGWFLLTRPLECHLRDDSRTDRLSSSRPLDVVAV